MRTLNEAKKFAANRVVYEHVADDFVVAVGSASACIFAMEKLAERIKTENLKIKCVPLNFDSKNLIISHNLPLVDLEIEPVVDVCIDGADEINANLNLITGAACANFLQEKIVASCSKKVIIIADYSKASEKLGQVYKNGIPVEVLPLAYVPVRNRIKDTFGGTVKLREAVRKAGPVVTDNGNFILDWTDFNLDYDWGTINTELLQIPGVVDTGLFINIVSMIYMCEKDGSVTVRYPRHK